MNTLPFHSVRRSNRRALDGKRSGARHAVYWSLERVRAGVKRFFAEHGRWPSAVDFDRVSYLPTARWVNMYFGNFREFRKQLGVDGFPDLTRGTILSKEKARHCRLASETRCTLFVALCRARS